MSDSEIAARLTEALMEAAGAGSELVSVNITLLKRDEIATLNVTTERKTRTLLFLNAEALAPGGARIATASSVHKLTDQT